jgi:hypothetical protein
VVECDVVEKVMRIFIAAMAIALLTIPGTIPAHAQANGPGGISAASGAGRANRPPEEPKVDPEKRKADEKAYKDGLKRVPDPDRKFDPWGTVRQGGK